MKHRKSLCFIAVLASCVGWFALTSACTMRGASNSKGEPGTQTVPGAQADIHVVSPVSNGLWLTPEGDVSGLRFSTLDQVNTSNVKNLHVVNQMATGIPHGHEGGPLVVNNTMYVVTPFPNYLIALDLTKPFGPIKWKYDPHGDGTAVGKACCDVVNRGAAYADGKVVYNVLDGNTVAVDANSGKEVWRTKVADLNAGETITNAPLIVRNHVYIGDSGGELGVRGKVTCLDLSSGKIEWRGYNSGPDNEVLTGSDFKPFYKKDQGQNLGMSSWPPNQWKLGGGTVWGWFTYDPELNEVYYGTGNPGVWNPDQRPGENKWSSSIMARDADTGHLKWAFQIVPHDEQDYDEIMENIAVDMNWQGKPRKLLIHPGRTGFVFVLDRETGELLSAEKFVASTNWADGYDLQTGYPRKVSSKMTHQGAVVENICPSSTGAKEFVPSSLSPRTGILYIPAHNTCMNYHAEPASYIAGTPYLGAAVKMFQGPGGFQGELVAWDIRNAKPLWTDKEEKFPVYSGVLSTAGDVVFYGTMDGWFKAIDARSGAPLWQFKTASGIVGNPMTYIGPDGKQYVAVYAGIGGWMGATAFPDVSADDDYAALGVVGAMKEIKNYSAPGGVLYVFGL